MPDLNVVPTRISIKALFAREEIKTEAAQDAFLTKLVLDSMGPALCMEGCEVESDGRCPHGNPSVLLAMGLI